MNHTSVWGGSKVVRWISVRLFPVASSITVSAFVWSETVAVSDEMAWCWDVFDSCWSDTSTLDTDTVSFWVSDLDDGSFMFDQGEH